MEVLGKFRYGKLRQRKFGADILRCRKLRQHKFQIPALGKLRQKVSSGTENYGSLNLQFCPAAIYRLLQFSVQQLAIAATSQSPLEERRERGLCSL